MIYFKMSHSEEWLFGEWYFTEQMLIIHSNDIQQNDIKVNVIHHNLIQLNGILYIATQFYNTYQTDKQYTNGDKGTTNQQ